MQFRNGETRYDGISIYFRGFYAQGDGACLEGSYRYNKGAATEIRRYAPQDKELHRIADELQAIQRKHFYRIKATVKHSGHYYHEFCTNIDVHLATDDGQYDYPNIEVQKQVTQLLRNFMRWIYRSLEREYDCQNSGESVDENIVENDYVFTEDGSRKINVGSLS